MTVTYFLCWVMYATNFKFKLSTLFRVNYKDISCELNCSNLLFAVDWTISCAATGMETQIQKWITVTVYSLYLGVHHAVITLFWCLQHLKLFPSLKINAVDSKLTGVSVWLVQGFAVKGKEQCCYQAYIHDWDVEESGSSAKTVPRQMNSYGFKKLGWENVCHNTLQSFVQCQVCFVVFCYCVLVLIFQ